MLIMIMAIYNDDNDWKGKKRKETKHDDNNEDRSWTYIMIMTTLNDDNDDSYDDADNVDEDNKVPAILKTR